MDIEWTIVLNKEKIQTYIKIVGVILPSITLLFGYGWVYKDLLLLTISITFLIIFIEISCFYLLTKKSKTIQS